MILCEVNKNSLKVRTSELLTAGSREVNEVEFRFNSAWDGVAKTAVFRTEKKTVSVLLDGDKTQLPWEVLADVGEVVAVGVYGVSGETLVLPTVWGIIGKVVDAAKLGDEEKEPTPDVYQQILDKLNSMSWDTLENKPFTSIGSGLKVEDGTLTATAQGGGADITITDTAEVGEVLTVEEVDSEGKPTKWKTEKPTAEQKQADWEQNDETAADYVKNRTHYDSRVEETVEKSFTLTSESARMQKLFDDFTYDDIAKLKSIHCVSKCINSDDADASWEYTGDMTVDSTIDISGDFSLTEGSIYLIQALVNADDDGGWITRLYLIAKEEALSNEEITSQGVTALGLYYDCIYYADIDAIAESETITDAWTIVRETGEFKTIEPKYIAEVDPTAIKDMYYTATERMELAGYTLTNVNYKGSHDAYPFELGQVWNASGVNINYTNLEVKQAGDGTLYVGDLNLSTMPFYVTTTSGGALQRWLDNTAPGSMNLVGVSGNITAENVHQISEKYIPNTIAHKDELPSMAVLELTVSDTIMRGEISIGETYKSALVGVTTNSDTAPSLVAMAINYGNDTYSMHINSILTGTEIKTSTNKPRVMLLYIDMVAHMVWLLNPVE